MKRLFVLLLFGLNCFSLLGQPSPSIRSVSISNNNIQLGESFTIEVSSKNYGDDSNDGGISLSFPSFDSYGDDFYVYDIYGKQVLSGILQGSDNIISTNSLETGSYLIKIYSGQRVISQRVEI